MKEIEFKEIFGTLSDDVTITITIKELKEKLLNKKVNFLRLQVVKYIEENLEDGREKTRILNIIKKSNYSPTVTFGELLDEEKSLKKFFTYNRGVGKSLVKNLENLYIKNEVKIKTLQKRD